MYTVVAFVEPAKVYGSEEDVPGSVGERFETDREFLKHVRDVDHREFQRMPPFLETRRISK